MLPRRGVKRAAISSDKMRSLLWLACVAAGAGVVDYTTTPRAAKRELRDAVAKAAEKKTMAKSARKVAADTIQSRLATQTTRPVFEHTPKSIDRRHGRRLQEDITTWTERGWCSSGLDEHPSTGETTLSAEMCWSACLEDHAARTRSARRPTSRSTTSSA